MSAQEHKPEIRQALSLALGLDMLSEGIEFDAALFGGAFGLDSVDLVTAIVTVERLFNIEVPEDCDFAAEFETISSIAQLVDRLRNDKERTHVHSNGATR